MALIVMTYFLKYIMHCIYGNCVMWKELITLIPVLVFSFSSFLSNVEFKIQSFCVDALAGLQNGKSI